VALSFILDNNINTQYEVSPPPPPLTTKHLKSEVGQAKGDIAVPL
jgi:hypothetical protein